MDDKYLISAPARDAARLILRNFHLSEKGKIAANERNLAIIVDVCTQTFRIQKAVDQLVRQNPWLDKNELARNLDRLRESLRLLELVRNGLPVYARGQVDQPPVDDRYVADVNRAAGKHEFERRQQALRKLFRVP